MSDGEFIVMLGSMVIAAYGAFRWYDRLRQPSLAPAGRNWRIGLGFLPVICLAGLLAVLLAAAAADVRDAPRYLFMYVCVGAAWMLTSAFAFGQFGVSLRDDVVERRNPAAAGILGAVMIATTIIYAGGNIGNGPGWWVVLFAAGLGCVLWITLWMFIERACHAAERITVDRDGPFAARMGGCMVATGLICARGVAGDWESVAQTLIDFLVAWPAAMLAVFAIMVERFIKGKPVAASPVAAAGIAAAYLLAAVIVILASPPLSYNPVYQFPVQ